VHATEKNLTEYGDKVSEEDKAAIETTIADLRTSLEGDNVEDIKAKTEALSQAAMKLGEAMYAAEQAEGGAEGAPEGADAGDASDAAGDDVVDADFEEVNEDDKDDKDDKKEAS
jgi:molecular chaperone DnaK